MNSSIKQRICVCSAVLISALIFCGAITEKNMNPVGVSLPDVYTNAQNIHLFSNGSTGFILLGADDSHTKLTYLNNEGISAVQSSTALSPLTMEFPYTTAFTRNNHLYIAGYAKLNSSASNTGVTFTSYQLGQCSQTCSYSCLLGKINGLNEQSITVDCNENIYTFDNVENKIKLYNPINKNISVISPVAPDICTSVCVSPNQYLYVTYASGTQVNVINVKNSVPSSITKKFNSDIPAVPYRFLSSSTAIDASGAVFSATGALPVFKKLYDTHGSENTACMLDNGAVLCKTDTRTVKKFAADGTITAEYHFDGDLLDLASNGTVTAAVVRTGNDLRFVDLSKPTTNGGTDISNSDESSTSIGSNAESTSSKTSSASAANQSSSVPQNSSSQVLSTPAGEDPSESSSTPSSSSQTPQPTSSIQSNAYQIDRNNELMYVNPSVSFAQLKQNIPVKGATLRAVKPNGTLVDSGNVGTGTVIELQANGKLIDRLTVVVKGDLVGSGNITKRDERILYSYLNSGYDLSELYLQAADMNYDGSVDTIDLLLLKRYS